MNWYSNIRAMIGTALCVAAAAAVCFAAQPPRQQAQAQLLDHAEFLCANCFFGASDYYYCFAAGDQILIGYQKTPVLNWEDQSKNYMTGIRPRWQAWTAPGPTVPISYDDKHIWVSRAESKPVKEGFGAHVKDFAIWATRGDRKQVKLTRSSMADIFTHNSQCRAASPAKAK